MSEIVVAVLSMPDELFWSDAPLTRMQHNNIRKEAARELAALKEENERLSEDLLRSIGFQRIAENESAALKARVAELEKERQALADAAYSAIIAFNNLQDESLDGEARCMALLKHSERIRILWNIFATQDNARFKEPANEEGEV